MLDIKRETRRIIAAHSPESSEETAAALQELWSLIPPKDGGVRLVKADLRNKFKALGVPVPVLKEIGSEVGTVAHTRIDDFLPLARRMWACYGREGRLVASTFLGSMELAAPERVIPVLRELAETCITWEDCDQLAMSALEPVVRKEPEQYLDRLESWIHDPNKWVRRAAITVIGRLPMKQPAYAEKSLLLVEPALGDEDPDVRRALSFAIRFAARGDAQEVAAFIKRQADRTDPASIWVLCDVMRSMTKKLLPQFIGLLPLYEKWLETVDAKSRRSVASAINVLSSVSHART